VNATSSIGKASSAGVSAVPSAENADKAAQAPRIQRVLTRQPARSARSSPVGANRPRTQVTNLEIGGVVVVGTVIACMGRS
jgi:hypothetical protein